MEVSVNPWKQNQDSLYGLLDSSVDYTEENTQKTKTVDTLDEELKENTSNKQSLKNVQRSKLRKRKIRINTSKCRSELKLMRILIERNGWKECIGYEGDLMWSGLAMNNEQLDYSDICLNRFPKMDELTHKKTTGYFLNLFQEYFPNEFDFFPKTFLIPEQLTELKSEFSKNSRQTFISKPSSGCQGDGIRLLESVKDIPISVYTPNANELVVQQYLSNPMLIGNKKFDLRLYVLISSLDPLIVYIHEEGLARFCTETYEKPSKSNINNFYMHLTNYSLNKNSPNFILPGEDDLFKLNNASKRTMQVTWRQIINEGYDKVEIISQIEELVRKFIASMHPYLLYNYKLVFNGKQPKRFHIIGFDIILDKNGKPWFLEANANPSFNIEHEVYLSDGKKKVEASPIDQYVKVRVAEDAILIVTKKIEKQLAIGQGNSLGGFKQIICGDLEELSVMDVFSDILKIYGKLSGFRFNSVLTSSKFTKLSNYEGMRNDKLTKNDYDLIFRKIILTSTDSNQMNFLDFIRAIELLASRLLPDIYNPSQKLPAVSQLVNKLLSQI